MHKPRQRPRVARVLSYGRNSGKKWRLNVCVIAGSFLLLATVAVLQLRLAIIGHYASHESRGFSVNLSPAGRGWKERLWQEGWGGDVDERGQRMEQKVGIRGSDGRIGGERSPSEEQDQRAEDDEPDRDEEMENEMDMDDEEGGEDFEGFAGVDAGEWQDHDSGREGNSHEGDNGISRKQVQNRGLMEGGGTSQSGEGALHSSDTKTLAEGAQSKAMERRTSGFSSDDEPLDDETRERVEQMANIEDVLMLNAAKKDSWGRTQDEQSSKKEKGLKLSPNPLNPENNPLLQDPDSADQVGRLTKNDRALLKVLNVAGRAVHSSFADQHVDLRSSSSQGSPDGGAQVGDSKERTRNEDLHQVQGEHNDVASKVRALDESKIKDKVDEQESLEVESEPSKSTQSKGEATSSKLSAGTPEQKEKHKKKVGKKVKKKRDMRGWGIPDPGLFPDITFSNFMEAFLYNETCSLRVFMAWLTPPWSFTVRHQRVLESLLYFHPSACVVVFSETIELDFFKSFTDEGYRIAAVMPNLEELLENTPAHVFARIVVEWRMVDLFHLHYTELLRLGALYKYGGIYMDFDLIVLKPLTSLSNTVGSEVLENGNLRPNGAIMIFDKFSPFLNSSMAEFTATYDEKLRDWNGADLLDRVMKAPPDGNGVKLAIADKPNVKPPTSFFPLSSESISRYFRAPEDDVDIAQEVELFNDISLQSFAVHLWNGLTFKLIPEPGSLVDKVMGQYCLHCTDIL